MRRHKLGVLGVLGAGLTVALGLRYAGDHKPSTVDTFVAAAIEQILGGNHMLLEILAAPSTPAVVVGVVVLTAVVCGIRRNRRGVALAVAGYAIPVALNTWVLKPAFERYYDGYLAYPSGHTVSLVAALTVLALLARSGLPTWTVAAAGAVLVIAAGIGMVGLGYHYPTDIVGGAAFAIATTIGTAYAIDTLMHLPPMRRGDPGQAR